MRISKYLYFRDVDEILTNISEKDLIREVYLNEVSFHNPFDNCVAHGALHGTTALRKLGAADEEEEDESQKREDGNEQEPGCRR